MRGFAVLEGVQCTGAASGLREIDAAPLSLMRKIYRKSLPPHRTEVPVVGRRISSPLWISEIGNACRFDKGGGSGRCAGLLLREAGEGAHAKHGGGGVRARGISESNTGPARSGSRCSPPPPPGGGGAALRGSLLSLSANEGCSTLTRKSPESSLKDQVAGIRR